MRTGDAAKGGSADGPPDGPPDGVGGGTDEAVGDTPGERGARALPLPTHRHVPGRNARPDDALFARVRALLPPETCDAGADANVPWRYGLRLLEAGFHWEAHEVLEGVWLRAAPNARERHLVQATIHLANGALKAAAGREAAAARVAARARESLGRAFPGGEGRLMGLDASALVRAVEHLGRETPRPTSPSDDPGRPVPGDCESGASEPGASEPGASEPGASDVPGARGRSGDL